MIIYVLWLALCLLNGFLGRKRKIGFWGFFLMSLMVSLVPAILSAITLGPQLFMFILISIPIITMVIIEICDYHVAYKK